MKRKLTLFMLVAIVGICMLTLAGCGNLLGGLMNVEGEEAETAQLKSKEQVEAALGDSYEITVKYGSQSSENGVSNDDEWSTMSTTKVANGYSYTRIIDLTEEEPVPEAYLYGNGFLYSYDAASAKYTGATAAAQTYYGGYSYIMSYVGDALEYNKVEDATVINRACKKYTRNMSVTVLGNSVGMNYVYYIDNATGICLKYEMSGGATTAEGSSSGSISYAVTELKIGNADLSAEIAKIAVVEWPTAAQFTSLGLTAVAKPAGTFNGGSVTLEDGSATEITSTLIVADYAAARQVCENLYNAGANKTSGGEDKALNSCISGDTSYLTFSAYTANGADVYISGYSNGDGFMISLSFNLNS